MITFALFEVKGKEIHDYHRFRALTINILQFNHLRDSLIQIFSDHTMQRLRREISKRIKFTCSYNNSLNIFQFLNTQHVFLLSNIVKAKQFTFAVIRDQWLDGT